MRLMPRSFFVLVVGSLLGSSIAPIAFAQSELYTCKDDSGRVITSDRPIQECAKRDVRVLRSDGIQKGVIPAPLTEAQRKQRDIDEEAARVRANIEREKQMRDRALLAAYPDLATLESARKRRLEEIQIEIDSAKQRIILKYPELTAAQNELEFYKGKKVPSVVTNKIQISANAILVEDELIRSKQAEIVQVQAKFNGDAKRIRELQDPATGRLAQAIKH